MKFVEWYKKEHILSNFNGTIQQLREAYWKENQMADLITLDATMRAIGELATDYEIQITLVPLFGVASLLQAKITIKAREKK